jgi:hypothetical protein
MLEKLFWFGAGYLVARYLILRDGIEAYKAKEAELISTGKEKIDGVLGTQPQTQGFVDEYDEFVDEYENY